MCCHSLQILKASSAQARNETASIIVGVTISFPGNVPHVTGLTDLVSVDSKSPARLAAKNVISSGYASNFRFSFAQSAAGMNNSTKGFESQCLAAWFGMSKQTYLLKDESVPWAPSKNFIRALDSIDGWLASNRPPSFSIQFQKLFADGNSFRVESILAPRYRLQFTSNIAAEDAGDIVYRDWIAP